MSTGPAAPERNAQIAYRMDRATDSFCEWVEDAVGRGEVTMAEVSASLQGCPDFADAWEEWCRQAQVEGEEFWPAGEGPGEAPVSDPAGTVAG